MARFSSAPIKEVLPQRKQRQPSHRAQTQQQYQEAVRNALIEQNEALVVELDPYDKPLTIRNRIKRATDTLGLENVSIRRRGDRIIVYRSSADEPVEDDLGSARVDRAGA